MSSVVAGAFNCFFMRQKELQGVEVLNSEKQVLGTSKIAGKLVLKDMIISRSMLSLTTGMIPVVLIALMSMAMKRQTLPVPLQTVCMIFGLGVGLPMSVAVFNPYLELNSSILEPEF
eukprot:CAMPEP_0116896552 /NCGR_PEP_ID=MMETSP0467-20121206/5766_1 /TAXON_ID=283647 /ORGANISM="Mesodinium pulex, Strain SPMC105" /LENGTH=116 /DNA_ID=CAMNT_0004567777 /DNA_START=180 /DNA_END=530 /DNA_ORIENTATION=+